MASKIAAQLYTLREFTKTPEDIEQTMARVAAIGYQAVQLSGLGPMDPQALREVCDRHGLFICATHVGFDRMWEDLAGVIREHQAYGCPYPGVGGHPGEYGGSADGYRRFAHDASEIGRQLKAADMTFVYHNHSHEFEHFDGVRGMDILLAESDPEAFTFELDTYWVAHAGASPVAWIDKCAGRIGVIHFKDMRYSPQRKQYYCEVGEGNLDWPAIIAACEDTAVEWYIVEQDECDRDPFESMQISFDNLKAMGVE